MSGERREKENNEKWKVYYLHTSLSPCGWTPLDTDLEQELCVKDGKYEGPTRRGKVKENCFPQNFLFNLMREILKYHFLFPSF